MKKAKLMRTNRIISVVLALAMLLSMFTIGGFTASATDTATDTEALATKVWDGSTRTKPVDSNGDGVYEINNAAELAYVVYNSGAVGEETACSFILTDDIYINDPSQVDWSEGTAIDDYKINSWYRAWLTGSTYVDFQGTIDGDYHTVYGLYYSGTDSYNGSNDAAALIPRVAIDGTTTIKNLAVDYAYVSYTNGVSAFVGWARSGSTVNISNCYAGRNVTLNGGYAGAFRATAGEGAEGAAGGLLENCYSLAETNSTAGYYGLAAYTYDSAHSFVLKNCYNANGPLSFGTGAYYYCSAENCYETIASKEGENGTQFTAGVTVLTDENMQGADALTNASKMSGLASAGVYYSTDTYPVLYKFAKKSNPELFKIWNGSLIVPEGEGTEESPYLISIGAELAYVVSIGGKADAYYKLTDDIYLNDVDKIDWKTGAVTTTGYTPNGWYEGVAFQGNINGDGHVVYGLYTSTDTAIATGWGYSECYGLIPLVAHGTTATIKELGIDNVYLKAADATGAFVGYAGSKGNNPDADYANVTIDQCYVGTDVYLNSFNSGTFVGGNIRGNIAITNSYSLGTANDVSFAKTCFVGDKYSSAFTFQNCYNANGTLYAAWDSTISSNSSNNYATGYDVDKTASGGDLEAFYATKVDADNMKGADVFTNTDKMPNLNSTGMFVANEDATPTLVAFLGYDIVIGDEVWNGKTTEPTSKDDDGNILIGTAEELAYIIENGGAAGANYKLTSDIYLNALDYIDWETGAVTPGYIPNSWYCDTVFQGNIDGDGYTVYGLYYNVPGTTGWGYEGVGLVPRVSDGMSVTISNLAVDNAYVCSINGVSAFVGVAGPTYHNDASVYANVTVKNCYAGENVTLKGHHAGVFRGATFRSKTVIENCYTFATTSTLSAENGASGIFGNEWGSNTTVKNVYNANGGVGGQDASLANKTLTNVYVTDITSVNGKEYSSDYVTLLTAAYMQGRDALENPNKLYKLNSDNAFEATNSYPILVSFIKDAANEIVEEEELVIWDGKIATELEGEGTEASPYLISNGAELAYAISNGGGANEYYKLTANIYLNDISAIDWTTGEVSDGYSVNSWLNDNSDFQGTLNGDGYIVYGLYANEGNETDTYGYKGQGLIPRVNDNTTANIIALGVDKAYIKASNAASAFVGFAGPTAYDDGSSDTVYATVNIDQCFVGEDVYITAYGAGAFRGGGYKNNTNITNSYSLATVVSSEAGTDGFIGGVWNGYITVNNSYNANGSLCYHWSAWTGTSANNYATGWDEDKTASGEGYVAYKATKLDAANMQGLDVFTNESKMPNLNSTGLYTATEGYPVLTVFALRGTVDTLKIWDGSTMTLFDGSGTEADPYLISYAAQLANVISSGGAKDTYYKLTDDIYLNNIYMIDWTTGEYVDGYIPNSWYSDIAFQGNIDGDGHVVYGLYYNDNAELAGYGYNYNSALIPEVNDGTSVSITNLGIENAFIHAAQGASAFVGFMGPTSYYTAERATVTIDNCYAGAKVYLEGGNTGVFRGGAYTADLYVSNSYSLANTTGATYNGLVGNFWNTTATFTNVYNANGTVATDTGAVGKVTATNVYVTDNTIGLSNVNVITANDIIGETALETMDGLSSETFKAIPNYYPVLTKFAENKLVKNNRVYYGVAINDAVDFYMTATGEQYFWRYGDIFINSDSSMDVSDLVLLTLQFNAGTAKADVDGDNNATTDDIKILRKALLGKTDYIESPLYSVGSYAPSVATLSSDYQYVWGDEFDGDTLNTQKWGIYSKMNGSSGDYEGGVTVLKDETAIGVGDGKLRLTAYKTDDGNYVVPASVVTQNTMNFRYGYVEIRAMFPVQEGVWSSWWTKSVFDKSDTYNLAYPSTEVGAEIDMIEVFDTNEATFNIIKWWEKDDGSFGSWYPNAEGGAHKKIIEPNTYYTFGYEWTEDEVIMYCDGVEYGRYDISEPYTEVVDGRNAYADTSGTDMSCFDAHQFLIFNNHLFYPTVSDASTAVTENAEFTSADYLIDYCRVYQKVGDGASDIVTK